MRKRLGFSFSALFLGSIFGCGRVSTLTDVHADGSLTRTIKFHGQAPDEKNGVSIGPKLEDTFIIPSGAPWKVTRAKEKDELIVTATRDVPKGETLKQDLVIRGKIKGNPGRLVVNELAVRQVAPGRLEYREVLHYQGDRPKEMDQAAPELTSILKSTLPANLAAEAEQSDLTRNLIREIWRTLFGPGDPLISQLMMHPDLAERRLKMRLAAAVDKTLQQKFGNRMTLEQRQAVTRKLVATAAAKTSTMGKDKSKAGPPEPGGNDDGGLQAIFISVRLPGKVVATNGERDESTGEVFWALYSLAPALEDVVLTATCETGK